MTTYQRMRDYHAQLTISRGMEVRREEYLDYMTFRRVERPLFVELFGPLVGLEDDSCATATQLTHQAIVVLIVFCFAKRCHTARGHEPGIDKQPGQRHQNESDGVEDADAPRRVARGTDDVEVEYLVAVVECGQRPRSRNPCFS